MGYVTTRVPRYLAGLTVVAGLVLSASSAAIARPEGGCQATITKEGKEFTVDVDSGERLGSYDCRDGRWVRWQWQSREYSGYTEMVRVDSKGGVSIDSFTFDDAAAITEGEFSALAEELSGVEAEPIEREVIVADNGVELTDEQVDLLLDGERVDGVKVLGVVDRPDRDMTFVDIVHGYASDETPVVVLARSWLGRLWKFIKSCRPTWPPGVKCTVKW